MQWSMIRTDHSPIQISSLNCKLTPRLPHKETTWTRQWYREYRQNDQEKYSVCRDKAKNQYWRPMILKPSGGAILKTDIIQITASAQKHLKITQFNIHKCRLKFRSTKYKEVRKHDLGKRPSFLGNSSFKMEWSKKKNL